MLDMTRSSEAVKPPACGEPVSDLGITKQPDPHRVVWMDRDGVRASIPFEGYDSLFACFMREGVSGLRIGTLVVLTPLHWSAQQWGHS